MSFAKIFEARWESVIRPAISSVEHNGARLEPFRVDLSKKSDAILVEILEAIATSSLVVADITASNELDGRPVRNGNVMYEVGLAHSARLPEEVILFRSDKLALDFDIAGVRVHSYEPDGDAVAARGEIRRRIADALSAKLALKRKAVQLALQRLTLPALDFLFSVFMHGSVKHPQAETVVQALGAIRVSQAIELLLELGCIRAQPIELTPNVLREIRETETNFALLAYVGTSFGQAVLEKLADEMGMTDARLLHEFENGSATSPRTETPASGS
jgi:hypothetical protein